MKYKKILALATAATMIVGYSIPAFADGVTGEGVVEYDDSEAVAYDSVTVPTLTASKYNFEVDPTGLLNTYDADQYETGSVYFSSVSTYASLVPNATKLGTDKLYTASKGEYAVDSTSGKWKGIVKTASTDSSTGVITVSELNTGFYVWTPSEVEDTHYTKGKAGTFVELDKTNFSKWLKVVETSSGVYELTLLNNYKAGDDVCDGKIYTTLYTEIPAAGIKEGAGSAVKIADYATVTDNNGTPSVKYTNVYTRSGSAEPYTYALLADDSDKMDYTAEKTTKNNKTDAVNVTNKSTKDKKVKAVITMSNTTGLTFKATDAYTSGEDATSVYFAATDGTTAFKFVAAEDGATASATYEVTVGKKTGGEDVTYQTTATNAAGGHKYARYEGANPTYNTNGFYITASANTDAAAKTAWEKWAAGLTATTRPSINIVYTISNVLSAAEEAAAFKTTYATILAKTTSTIEYADLTNVEAALTAYAALAADVKAELTTEKALLDELKTAAEAKAITDVAAFGTWDGTTIWLGSSSSDGFTGDSVVVEVTKDGETWVALDSAKFTYDEYKWVQVAYSEITAAAGGDPTTTSYIRVVDGTTRYTFTDE